MEIPQHYNPPTKKPVNIFDSSMTKSNMLLLRLQMLKHSHIQKLTEMFKKAQSAWHGTAYIMPLKVTAQSHLTSVF